MYKTKKEQEKEKGEDEEEDGSVDSIDESGYVGVYSARDIDFIFHNRPWSLR
jgi:hypothetical protein